MKNKLITILFGISIMTLTACGTTTDSVDSKNIVFNIEADTNNQMEDIQVEWKELGSMDNYAEFRELFDNVLGNKVVADGGKIGTCYTNMANYSTNNSTLRFAFNQKDFYTNLWENEEATAKLNEAVKNVYADIKTDSEARLAAINAYYGLFGTPEGYFNGGDSLTRAEFLSGVYKAHNPVSTLEANIELTQDEFNPFVNQMIPNSYLDLTSDTVADSTYSGIITRGEAIYTVVKMYYGHYLDVISSNFPTDFSDLKESNKKSNNRAYDLSQAIQDEKFGVPVDIYKAVCIAGIYDLIDGDVSRWNEAITKAEALDLITRAYELTIDGKNNTGETDFGNREVEHISKDEFGNIVYSLELLNEIDIALKEYGLDESYMGYVKKLYAEQTADKDNTQLHKDIIVNYVKGEAERIQSIKEEYAKQQAEEQAKKEQEAQSNKNNNSSSNVGSTTDSNSNKNNNNSNSSNKNNNSNSSNKNNSNSNNNTSNKDNEDTWDEDNDGPWNWETEPSGDPWNPEPRPGETVMEFDEAGDGGELITDGYLNMP